MAQKRGRPLFSGCPPLSRTHTPPLPEKKNTNTKGKAAPPPRFSEEHLPPKKKYINMVFELKRRRRRSSGRGPLPFRQAEDGKDLARRVAEAMDVPAVKLVPGLTGTRWLELGELPGVGGTEGTRENNTAEVCSLPFSLSGSFGGGVCL